MVKQKDKKGSRFFDLFRKGKKSKTKHSDEKPEGKEQEHELPDQQPNEPPEVNDGNATSDLDEGFRDSQDGSEE